MPLDHLGFDNFRIFGSIHRISCNLRSPFVTLWHNYEEKEEQQQANLGERIATRSPAQTSRHEVDIVRLLFSTHLGKMTKSFDNSLLNGTWKPKEGTLSSPFPGEENSLAEAQLACRRCPHMVKMTEGR
ncbi:uncharacterized protein LOC144005396 isoform X1 [Festucalex cinctus]